MIDGDFFLLITNHVRGGVPLFGKNLLWRTGLHIAPNRRNDVLLSRPEYILSFFHAWAMDLVGLNLQFTQEINMCVRKRAHQVRRLESIVVHLYCTM